MQSDNGFVTLTVQQKRRRYWQFSSLEMIYWFAMATAGYLTVYLQGIGYSPSQIGQISAANAAVRIFAAPIMGIMADKIGSVKKVFITCILIGSLLWALVPFASGIEILGISLTLIVIPASMFFRNPASALVDNWVVQSVNREGLNYGTIRLWGSISYAVMCMILSAVLPKLGVEWTFYMLFWLIVPMVLVSISIKDSGSTVTRKKSLSFRELRIGRLFKNYYYVTYLIYAIVLNIPMNTGHTFLPYLVEHVGGDTAMIGIITGYKAILEIPMLFIIGPLRKKKVPFYAMLLGAACFYTAEMLLYSTAVNFTQLVIISTCYGLGGGLSIGAAANYIYTLTPRELKATAQTVNGSVTAVAAIVGSLIGGLLLEKIGIVAYYRLVGLIMAGAAIFFAVTLYLGKKVWKIPVPEMEHN